jgi:hypothetical protein
MTGKFDTQIFIFFFEQLKPNLFSFHHTRNRRGDNGDQGNVIWGFFHRISKEHLNYSLALVKYESNGFWYKEEAGGPDDLFVNTSGAGK